MRNILYEALNNYNLKGKSYNQLTQKCMQVKCEDDVCYLIKKTNLNTEEKFQFLNSQGIDNILYPISGRNGKFVSNFNNDLYYVTPYYKDTTVIEELKVQQYNKELSNLHLNTYYRKELTPLETRKKLESIYEYLQYKFNVLEAFVRTIEARSYDEYSIVILKEYQHILNTKKIMGKLNKKIINDVKSKKVVNRSFIHNNPKLNHLLNYQGHNYFISLERSKIGISSLDMAKFYIEIEDLNINHKEYINSYFNQYDDSFYFDYFCFLVMLYYLKSIVIIDKDYISSQSFIYASGSLKKFIARFNLQEV